MAAKKKPQQEKATPAVKKAAKKKAPTKKRVTRKKAVTKKAATKKVAVKQSAGTMAAPTAVVAAQSEVVAKNEPPVSESQAQQIAPQNQSTSGTSPEQKRTAARHVWWRAAIMVGVVALVFVYIRNSTHDTGDDELLVGKTMAPSPWGSEVPMLEQEQPHPWELAPLPQGGDFSAQQPYNLPQTGQATPSLQPWQPPQNASGQATQPYYPPPPGYYGYPPSPDINAPAQH